VLAPPSHAIHNASNPVRSQQKESVLPKLLKYYIARSFKRAQKRAAKLAAQIGCTDRDR
jgi:hypothetical protein